MVPAIVDTVITQTTVGTRVPRATRRQETKVVKSTIKKSWHVSQEAIRRLGVHAAMEDRSESSIVDELLCGLNRYTMPAANTRGSKGTQKTADTEEDRKDIQAA
jgi:hypothetical protein